jgi:hypothetical protein
MEASKTTTDNKKSQVQKISDTSYNLMKDSQIYLMNITYNDQNLNINVKRLLGTSSYEAVYTFDDIKQASKFFLNFDDCKEAHHELTQKFNDQSVEFTEEVDMFTLKFEFTVGTRKSEAVLKIKKRTEENLEGIVDEMGKSIITNSESIKELKMENTELKEMIYKLQGMMDSLQEEFKILKKNGMIGIEYSQILEREEIEQMKKWVDHTNYNKVNFKLLYRATEHGKGAKDFHSRCDNKVRKS